jgi:uncharacterized membrane protein
MIDIVCVHLFLEGVCEESMAETLTVIGIYADYRLAEQAILDLKRAGFRDDQLGFVVRRPRKAKMESREGMRIVAGGVIAGLLGAADALLLPVVGPTDAATIVTTAVPVVEEVLARLEGEEEKETKAEPSTEAMTNEATAGANEGVETASEKRRKELEEGVDATAGGVLGGFLGIAAAFLIPGIGPVVAGGILLTALAGAAIGAITGDIIGAFVSMGVPEQAAHRYAREFEAGRTIVTVRTEENRLQEVLDVLHSTRALEVQVH